MKTRYTLAWLLAVGLASTSAAAIQADAQHAERQAAEEARAAAETARRSAEAEREAGEREVRSVEEEMRAAEARLEEAARRIAELSTRQLPEFDGEEFAFAFGGRPLLGISIDGDTESGPVEGVRVQSVTPGGAAFEAGLRAGDVLTAINDESLAADSSAAANRRLLEFMEGVEEGDTLDVEYLRDGNVATVDLQPKAAEARRFAFSMAPRAPGAPHAPLAPIAPVAPGSGDFVFIRRGASWADMEMVALNEGLGRYFGTDKGLLVVRAPEDEALELEDGDVIQSIGGREPRSVSHAVRILASYQPGETLELEIMRDKRSRTLEIEIPDNRQGRIGMGAPVVVDVERIVRE